MRVMDLDELAPAIRAYVFVKPKAEKNYNEDRETLSAVLTIWVEMQRRAKNMRQFNYYAQKSKLHKDKVSRFNASKKQLRVDSDRIAGAKLVNALNLETFQW